MRLHGDDAPAQGPDLLEPRHEQPPSLRRLGLKLPERREVAEQLFGAVDRRVGRRTDALPAIRAELVGNRKGLPAAIGLRQR